MSTDAPSLNATTELDENQSTYDAYGDYGYDGVEGLSTTDNAAYTSHNDADAYNPKPTPEPAVGEQAPPHSHNEEEAPVIVGCTETPTPHNETQPTTSIPAPLSLPEKEEADHSPDVQTTADSTPAPENPKDTVDDGSIKAEESVVVVAPQSHAENVEQPEAAPLNQQHSEPGENPNETAPTGDNVVTFTPKDSEHEQEGDSHPIVPEEEQQQNQQINMGEGDHVSESYDLGTPAPPPVDDEFIDATEMAILNAEKLHAQRRLQQYPDYAVQPGVYGMKLPAVDLSPADMGLSDYIANDYGQVLKLADIATSHEMPYDVHVRCSRLLATLCALLPDICTILLQRDALVRWIYEDIIEQMDEIVEPVLNVLMQICLSGPLPEDKRALLGRNLVLHLINMAMATRPPSGGDLSDQCRRAIFAVMAVNSQFSSPMIRENRVIHAMVTHAKPPGCAESSGAFAQLLIAYVNRYGSQFDFVTTQLFKKLVCDVYQNEALAPIIFFVTDTSVLVEVTTRHAQDTTNDAARALWLELVEGALRDNLNHEFMGPQIVLVRKTAHLLSASSESQTTRDLASRLAQCADAAIID